MKRRLGSDDHRQRGPVHTRHEIEVTEPWQATMLGEEHHEAIR